MILQKGTLARDVVVYNARNRIFIPVASESYPLRNAQVTGFLTVPGSPDFLMQILRQTSTGVLRVWRSSSPCWLIDTKAAAC